MLLIWPFYRDESIHPNNTIQANHKMNSASQEAIKSGAPAPSTVHIASAAARVENHMIHIMSVIQTMKHQESTYYKTSPYLHNVAVTEKDRHAMCQWGFDIVDGCQVCQIDRYVATVAISYFDRFLSCRGLRSVEICSVGRRDFQLAFVVSTGLGWAGLSGAAQIRTALNQLLLHVLHMISLTFIVCIYTDMPRHCHKSLQIH